MKVRVGFTLNVNFPTAAASTNVGGHFGSEVSAHHNVNEEVHTRIEDPERRDVRS